jgi:hypothetical protein
MSANDGITRSELQDIARREYEGAALEAEDRERVLDIGGKRYTAHRPIWACLLCDSTASTFYALEAACECPAPTVKVVPDTPQGWERLAGLRETYRSDLLK